MVGSVACSGGKLSCTSKTGTIYEKEARSYVEEYTLIPLDVHFAFRNWMLVVEVRVPVFKSLLMVDHYFVAMLCGHFREASVDLLRSELIIWLICYFHQ